MIQYVVCLSSYCIVLKIEILKDEIYVVTLGLESSFEMGIDVGFYIPAWGRNSESRSSFRIKVYVGIGSSFRTKVVVEFRDRVGFQDKVNVRVGFRDGGRSWISVSG